MSSELRQRRLAVLAGGAVGTAARALIVTAVPVTAGAFPWATLAANVAGAGLLGHLTARWAARPASPVVAAFAATGLLGSFTTFSTFALELRTLVEVAPATAAAYAAVSVVAGLLAATAGTLTARRPARP